MDSECNHTPDKVLYFCTCNNLLCESCQGPHMESHKIKKQDHKLREVHTVRKETAEYLENRIQNFGLHLNEAKNFKKNKYKSVQYMEGIQLINKTHAEVLNLVNTFFKELHTEFENRINSGKQDIKQRVQNAENEIGKVTKKIKDLTKEINNMKKPAVWQPALKTAMTQETKKEMEHVISILEETTTDKVKILVNPKTLESLVDLFNSSIRVFSDEEEEKDYFKKVAVHKNKESKILKSSLDSASYSRELDKEGDLKKKTDEKNVVVEDIYIISDTGAKEAQKFDITLNNFFHPACSNKLLHFFEGASKNLYLVYLADGELESFFTRKFTLNINFDIPIRHRSLITPLGDIFITGGAKDEKEFATTYKLNLLNGTLIEKKPMHNSRKSHGFCYMDGFLYAIGGYDTMRGALTLCEKYDIKNDEWIKIAPMHHISSSPCVCGFKDRYIMKIGGLEAPGEITQELERYDVEKDVWTEFHIRNSPSELKKMNFEIPWLAASCQISKDDILIFGGCDEKNKGVANSFLLEISETSASVIKKHNVLPMPYAAGFWNAQCVIAQGKVYALQNQLIENEEIAAHEGKRNLLSFDGTTWKILKL